MTPNHIEEIARKYALAHKRSIQRQYAVKQLVWYAALAATILIIYVADRLSRG